VRLYKNNVCKLKYRVLFSMVSSINQNYILDKPK